MAYSLIYLAFNILAQVHSIQQEELSFIEKEKIIQKHVLQLSLLDNLLIWDPSTSQWRAALRNSEIARVKHNQVSVIHLWAYYCEACRMEWASLNYAIEKIKEKNGNPVNYYFIAEGTTSESMQKYIEAYHAELPRLQFYHDTQGQIASVISRFLPDRKMQLPITIILDKNGIIRYAFWGPLDKRVKSFVFAVEHLLAGM